MWEKFDEMFPEGYIEIDGKRIDKNYAIANNIETIGFPMVKPVFTMIENEVHYFWHADGSMETMYDYSVFPNNMPDGVSLLNVYGRKIYNDYIASSNQ